MLSSAIWINHLMLLVELNSYQNNYLKIYSTDYKNTN